MGYPVGKVDTLDLYPLSFREFLDATGNAMLQGLADSMDTVSVNAFSSRIIFEILTSARPCKSIRRGGARAKDYAESLIWLTQAELEPTAVLDGNAAFTELKAAHPEIKFVRFGLSGYREQDWMGNVPLYALPNIVL